MGGSFGCESRKRRAVITPPPNHAAATTAAAASPATAGATAAAAAEDRPVAKPIPNKTDTEITGNFTEDPIYQEDQIKHIDQIHSKSPWKN